MLWNAKISFYVRYFVIRRRADDDGRRATDSLWPAASSNEIPDKQLGLLTIDGREQILHRVGRSIDRTDGRTVRFRSIKSSLSHRRRRQCRRGRATEF